MRKVLEVLERKGLRDQVKVMVGGAPVDAAFAGKIGADGYGKDAGEAVRLARELVAAG
jgi:5-methyltetrahydrofolate--homocysteine methyltransferase